jgi:ferric-dicitrate binding protein FerR (iron transport regulator)
MTKEQYIDIFEKYIKNKASEDEIRQLTSFIENNPRLNRWFEERIRHSPAEIDEDVKQRMFGNIRQQTGASGTDDTDELPLRSAWKKWMRIAAAIVLPVAMVYGLYRYHAAGSGNQTDNVWVVSAEQGEKANITLPDGSRVWLNSASKLTYSNTFNQKDRLLQLDGEAYFEVTHDAKKAFIVQCMDIKTEVLGTTFGIKAYEEDSLIAVVLIEGKVQITLPDKTMVMKPDERIVYDKTLKKLSSETVEPTDFTAWRENRLRFENEMLQDIATTISRIHNIDYVFEDESLKTIKFTGTIDNTSIESVLNSITLTSPVKCIIKDSLIVFQKDDRKKKYF